MKRMDDIFKQQLATYKQVPGDEVWANVAMELSGRRSRLRRKRIAWLSAAASVVLIIGFSLWWLVGPSPDFASTQQSIGQLKRAHYQEERRLLQNFIPDTKAAESVVAVTSLKATAPFVREKEGSVRSTPIAPLFRRAPMQFQTGSSPKAFLATTEPSQLPTKDEPQRLPLLDKRRLKLSGYVAPTYSYRFLSSATGTVDQQVRFYNGVEQGLASYAGGVHLSYQLSSRLSVKSGVAYHRMGQQLNHLNAFVNEAYQTLGMVPDNQYQLLSSSGPIAVNTGYFLEDNVHVRLDYASRNKFNLNNNSDAFLQLDNKVEQVYHYVSFPLHFQYRVLGKAHKGHVEVVAGMNMSLLIGNSLSLKHQGERQKMAEAENLSRWGLQGVVAIAYAFPLRTGFEFRIQPTFSSFVKPVNRGFETRSRPYEFALQTGFALSF
ncbi:MAG: outer membrane beta-barrel protein [Bacteroidales bacterium]